MANLNYYIKYIWHNKQRSKQNSVYIHEYSLVLCLSGLKLMEPSWNFSYLLHLFLSNFTSLIDIYLTVLSRHMKGRLQKNGLIYTSYFRSSAVVIVIRWKQLSFFLCDFSRCNCTHLEPWLLSYNVIMLFFCHFAKNMTPIISSKT